MVLPQPQHTALWESLSDLDQQLLEHRKTGDVSKDMALSSTEIPLKFTLVKLLEKITL